MAEVSVEQPSSALKGTEPAVVDKAQPTVPSEGHTEVVSNGVANGTTEAEPQVPAPVPESTEHTPATKSEADKAEAPEASAPANATAAETAAAPREGSAPPEEPKVSLVVAIKKWNLLITIG